MRFVPDVRSDKGSVLLLGVGLVALCMLAMTILIDASSAFLQRQRLQALADGAALAGAQAIDLDSYYVSGASESTRLNSTSVVRAARRHVESSTVEDADVRIYRLWSDGVDVVVSLAEPLRLPFLDSVFPGEVIVESRARLAFREHRSGS